MYNDGSIADRLREFKREADTAYARLNYVTNLLGEAYDKIHKLETTNVALTQQIEQLNLNSVVPDISESSQGEILNDSGRTKKVKRASS